MLQAFANYARKHEAVRKDIERLFGVLQKRFHILFHPCRQWSKEMMAIVVAACLVLHNMIVEDEYEDDLVDETDYERKQNRVEVACLSISQPLDGSRDPHDADDDDAEPLYDLHGFVEMVNRIRDEDNHLKLQRDLINHLWALKALEKKM